MKKTDSGFGNRDSVPSLASKQAEVNNLLNEQPGQARESDMPLSEAKNTAASTELKADILNAAVVLTAGYFSRKLNASVSLSPIKKLLGNVLIFGITYMVTKKTGAIKSVGKRFMDIIHSKIGAAANVEAPNAFQPIVRS
ncbi:MAG: hypothetical protein IPM82_21250 [Saprospiraceae bacterium]|nr:hypothetical protein [Saprospiraceae bacterium]